MIDIVDRLRDGAGHVPEDIMEAEMLMTWAADEIERLRAALKPFAECAEILEIQKVDAPDERMLMFASDGGGTFLGFACVKDLRTALRSLEQSEPRND